MPVAAVWAYEGLYCKVLGGAGDQRAIVASVPGLPAGWVTAALVTIGVLETALGAWALSGVRARLAAVLQTAVIVGFNAGGLVFAGNEIAEPGRLLVQNAAFLTLVWVLARG
ncbi:DoxX-like family protein [Fodinicola feengrottensis]|uniref:DoxX family protein n=1 Tax=Fodinicola feengrottensis TaxID=435914 RepID=A0ABN2GIW2_9ACTN|nr:DoxX-like family protein [Fodinicola feengrottensis]